MRRLLLTGVMLAASMLAPAAHAAADTIDGGCFILAVDLDSVTNFVTSGFLGDVSVTRDGAGLPTGATVTCWIEINGIESSGTRFAATGPGVQAGLIQVGFVRGDTDSIAVCERVAYADGTASATCAPPPDEQGVPPQLLFDAAHGAFESVVDPVLCPVLASQAGEYPGGLAISSTGDVSVTDPLDVAGTVVAHDCPPYGPQPTPGLVVVGPVRT